MLANSWHFFHSCDIFAVRLAQANSILVDHAVPRPLASASDFGRGSVARRRPMAAISDVNDVSHPQRVLHVQGGLAARRCALCDRREHVEERRLTGVQIESLGPQASRIEDL